MLILDVILIIAAVADILLRPDRNLEDQEEGCKIEEEEKDEVEENNGESFAFRTSHTVAVRHISHSPKIRRTASALHYRSNTNNRARYYNHNKNFGQRTFVKK